MNTLSTQDKLTHTPGPWEAQTDGFHWDVKGAMRGIVVAYCSTGDSLDAESESNARLIAAAPELLEACKRVLLHGANEYAASDMLIAAIAKAEGRE